MTSHSTPVLFFLSLLAVFLFATCQNKEKEVENRPPTLSLSFDQAGKEYLQSDTVRMVLEASDPEGELAEGVLTIVRINGPGIRTEYLNGFPQTIFWETHDAVDGLYRINASVADNLNEYAQVTDTVEIVLGDGPLNAPCPDVPQFTYEGQTYNTIKIGTQCWMAENLNVGTLSNNTQTNNGVIEKFCVQSNLDSCLVYGGLYTWAEAMQYTGSEGGQGICPPGWHIPTDADWMALEAEVDTKYGDDPSIWIAEGWRGTNVGGRLKTRGPRYWEMPFNTGSSNLSGFSLKGAGWAESSSATSVRSENRLWSSSASDAENAWIRSYVFAEMASWRSTSTMDFAYSVRCIKD